MPCSLVQVVPSFGVTCYPHYQGTCWRFKNILFSLRSRMRLTFGLNEWNGNSNVNYCSLSHRPLVYILSQMIPNSHPVSLRSMFFLSSHLCLCLLCGLLQIRFAPQNIVTLLPNTSHIPFNFTFLDFNTWIILDEEQNHVSLRYAILSCNFFQASVNSTLLCPSFLSTFQINQPTRGKIFTSLLLDVYVWLNIFWAPFRPSSGA